jgi:hypothetical protein
VLALVLGVPVLAFAQGQWVADRSGCRAWDNYPDPDDRIEWNGGCRDGYLDGQGTLRWIAKGENYETATGEFKHGMLEGHGVVDAKRGRFEGEFRGNRPNGNGTFNAKNGEAYSGNWTNGCFQQGNRLTTFYTNARECGF